MTPDKIQFAADGMFWRCPRCGKTFWRGSHVRDSLQRLERWLADGGGDTVRPSWAVGIARVTRIA
jgi:hypothetical protein